jgi:hypothetical protein
MPQEKCQCFIQERQGCNYGQLISLRYNAFKKVLTLSFVEAFLKARHVTNSILPKQKASLSGDEVECFFKHLLQVKHPQVWVAPGWVPGIRYTT